MSTKKTAVISLILLTIVIAAEFVIPTNPYLPTATELSEGVKLLHSETGFLFKLIATAGEVLAVLLLATGLAFVTVLLLPLKLFSQNDALRSHGFAGYMVPHFIIALLIITWFGNDGFAGFVVITLLTASQIVLFLIKRLRSYPMRYIEFFSTLSDSSEKAQKKLIQKLILPSIAEDLYAHHLSVWSITLIVGFLQNNNDSYAGVLRYAYDLWDTPLVFVSVMFLMVIIYFTGLGLKGLSVGVITEDVQ